MGSFLILIGILLLIIPGIVLAATYMFLLPVTVLELFNGRAALRRSRDLGRGSYARNVSIMTVCALLTFVIASLDTALIGLFEILVLRGCLPGR